MPTTPDPRNQDASPAPSRSASHRMRAVALAGSRLVSAHSMDDFVDVLRDSCEQVMELDDLGIGLYDAAAGLLNFTSGFDAGLPVAPLSVPVQGSPSARVIAERRTLVTLSSADPAGAGSRVIGTGRRSESIIRTPILSNDRVLGVIMVQSYTPGLYTAEDVEVLETLAAVSATALLNMELLAQRDRALAALCETGRRFDDLAGSIPQVFWIMGRTAEGAHELQYVSPAFQAVFGRAPGEVLGTGGSFFDCVHAEDRDRLRATMAEDWVHDTQREYRIVRTDGEVRWVEDRSFPVRGDDGAVVRVAGVAEDITERRGLEHRVRQAQKMEAVGQLAGGIAHDFNNLLTVISANLEFVREDLPATHSVRPDLDQIGHAASRARTLVQQLMTFSRQQPVQLTDVDLADVVAGAERQLRRLVGEEIVVEVHAASPALVRADPTQLEQVLVNLALNARDAMLTPVHGHPGHGGTLAIDVDHVDLPAGEAPEGLAPGSCVRLRVRDSGHGMDDATRSRAFEPFFTTRDVGAGTGLGLATVFGIVRQLGGTITIVSAPGEGATVTILLPARVGTASMVVAPGDGTPSRGRTVLLVDDEEPVRTIASRILRHRGFTVLEARHGADAMLLWAAHGSDIDVLLTDLRMPEVGGRELADALAAERPALPIVFMSGYSEEAASAARGPSRAFVEKPFTSESLVAVLETVLEAARTGQ